MRTVLGWACVSLALFALLFFGYSLYTPDLVRMQRSTVYLELRQDCPKEEKEKPGGRTCNPVLGHGAGVILENNRILTAGHVARFLKYDNISIVVRFRRGQETTAELVEFDWNTEKGSILGDIALLKAKTTYDYPAATVNCRAQPAGTSLYIVGHPSVTLWTITQGYVMGTVPRRGQEPGNWLAIDATIWRGNSGGPVFNRWGEIVGIVSHGIVASFGAPTGFNFAASGPTICEFLGEINGYSSCTGSYSYFGLRG